MDGGGDRSASDPPTGPGPEASAGPFDGPSDSPSAFPADSPFDDPSLHATPSAADPVPAGAPPRPLGEVEPDAAHLEIRTDRWAHRRAEPRALAAIWLFFLVGATLMTVGAAGIVGLIATDVYRPSVRVLLFITALGVGVAWPLIRLSQELPRSILRATLADAFVILGPALAMIVPQHLRWMAAWTVETIVALTLAMLAWGLLAAGLIALAHRHIQADEPHQPPPTPSIARAWWMAAILLLMCGGAFATLFQISDPVDSASASGSLVWMLSLPTALWELTRDRSASGRATVVLPEHRAALVAVSGAAIILWVYLLADPATRANKHPESRTSPSA